MEALLAAVLAPALPHLLKAGGDVAQELGTEAGRLAKALWDRIRPDIEARPAAQEAAADVAADPESELARKALEHQLAKLLAADPALAKEVGLMLEEGRQKGIVTTHVVMTGGQHAETGGVIVGGSVEGGVRTGDS